MPRSSSFEARQMTSPHSAVPPLTVDINGTDHLILMRCIADDRFGNPDKINGAYVDWVARSFQDTLMGGFVRARDN